MRTLAPPLVTPIHTLQIHNKNMSITLRDGFVDEPLERAMEDLLVRFLVNCPPEDLSSIERVFFHIEEAQWFYSDFLRQLNPLLPDMDMKTFSAEILQRCPVIWKWGDRASALNRFLKYKKTIPVRGVALLNEKMDKVLLVRSVQGGNWGFPRGKISKDESDLDCALRELKEETGFDAKGLVDESDFTERTVRGKNVKIFFAKNVPESTVFRPEVRNEIGAIQWRDIKHISNALKKQKYTDYMMSAFIQPLTQFVSQNRTSSGKSEELLKKRAAVQIKKLLGVGENEDETAVVDQGRQLLDMLHKVTEKQQSSDPAKQLLDILHTVKPTSAQNGGIASQQMQFPPGMQMPFAQFPFFFPQQFPFPQMPAFQPQFMPPGMPMLPFPMPPAVFHGLPPPPMPNMNSQGFHPGPAASVPQAPQESAPLASHLNKPTFGTGQRHSQEERKELLSILTKKPEPVVTSDSGSKGHPDSKDLLDRLYGKTQEPVDDTRASPKTSSLSPSNQLLGVLNGSHKNSEDSVKDKPASLLNLLKKDLTPFETQRPTPASNGLLDFAKKPLSERAAKQKGEDEIMAVLKPKSQGTPEAGNPDLSKNVSNPPTSISDSTDLLSILNKKSPESVTSSTDSSDLLSILNKKTEAPKPPSDSSSLLSLLNKKAPEATRPSNGSNELLTLLKKSPEIKTETKTETLEAEPKSNGSADLLSILNRKSPVPATANGDSSNLLSILKKAPETKAASGSSGSGSLLSILNKKSPEPATASSDSSNLLSLLNKKSPEATTSSSSASSDSSSLLSILNKKEATKTSNDSAGLLSILNRKSPETTKPPSDSANLLSLLNKKAEPPKKILLTRKLEQDLPELSNHTPVQVQPFKSPKLAPSPTQGILKGKKVTLLRRDPSPGNSQPLATCCLNRVRSDPDSTGEIDTAYSATDDSSVPASSSEPVASFVDSSDEELDFEDFDDLNADY
ncbi:unnamed protein product [Kuraishia capsulata CBS 1993]|uniref:Nudix hydrolase domain-containing protein n=1 Tax=Kuraishia capsulata CBS 1993 TaxID=1382522 RepID=W6MX57_9ASCO|nr:uncharacterized protein KUCA_T00004292001 [Kuraishia capsulata CBS 1993]CDK28310.1 unnamed protein product [Kuraishia capsulata CBS 1993]